MKRYNLFLSDIHGNVKALEQLQYIPELRESNIYFLGDYVDGFVLGKDSVQKTLEIVYQYAQEKQATVLLGNHDLMFLDFLNGNYQDTLHWIYRCGGLRTLQSFGCSLDADIEINRMRVIESLGPELMSFLMRFYHLPIYCEVNPNILAVHAGFDTTKPLVEQEVENMVWSRPSLMLSTSACHNDFFNRVLVTGHTVNRTVLPNQDATIRRKTSNYTEYFIDGGSNSSECVDFPINVLLLDDRGQFVKNYVLYADHFEETAIRDLTAQDEADIKGGLFL